MRILVAGKDGFSYNRTHILLEGLRALPKHQLDIFKIASRNTREGSLLKDHSRQADVVYVPPFRHRDLAFVKKYSQAPVVFDPLVSRYLTKVVDYGHYWKAPQKWWVDFRDFRNCDLLLADTKAHLQYFKKTLLLPSSLPCGVLPVGVDTKAFQPNEVPATDKFTIGFYGTFVPLQGIFQIIEAAKLLENHQDIHFEIIGTGHQYQDARKLTEKLSLKNLNFKGWVKYAELAGALENFDLCLGVFGTSVKTDLVVPNKLFHYAALGKPILTKTNRAITEVFTPGENIYTCGNQPQVMAKRILELKSKSDELRQTGLKSRQLMEDSYSPTKIAKRFIKIVNQHL